MQARRPYSKRLLLHEQLSAPPFSCAQPVMTRYLIVLRLSAAVVRQSGPGDLEPGICATLRRRTVHRVASECPFGCLFCYYCRLPALMCLFRHAACVKVLFGSPSRGVPGDDVFRCFARNASPAGAL